MRRAGELEAMRRERREARKATGTVQMAAAEGGLSGRLVIEATGLAKSFGGAPVVKDFSIRIGRGDRVGVVGPNGAGKTTLLNMLTGMLAPDRGAVRLGTNLEIVMLDQLREALRPESTLADTLTGGRGDWVTINGQKRHVASYLADFLFLPEQARSPVRVLSGGERARLLLARALAKPSNLLVLDEPTNDLDLETLDLLQELLAEYSGTVLLVSHDRDFLDRVVTSVVAAEGDGRWVEYAGGYTDMLAQAACRRQQDAGRAQAPRAEKAAARSAAGGRRACSCEAQAVVQGEARAGDAAEDDRGARSGDRGLAGEARRSGLYRRDAKAFTAATARLGAAQGELAAAEERWLEIEMLRDVLDG